MHRERSPGRIPGTQSSAGSPGVQHSLGPGKRTLTDGLVVQRREATAPSGDPAHVHAAAARGTATPASQLPHADRIQRAFGRHDISGIQAHVSSDASASAREMGAQAYAMGDHVVLGSGTDLHTVAHEAAHVVQQRAGVQLKAGVGEVGDTYERHADAVADRVVRGESAEALLDQHAGGSARPAVQRITREELVARGAAIEQLGELAPEQSMNLWVARNEQLGATIHLLGTMHSRILRQMKEGKAIIAYLSSRQFTHVYSEIAHDISGIDADQGKLTTAIDTLNAGEPDRKTQRPAWVSYMQNKNAMETLVGSHGLDEMYAAIALNGSSRTASLGLETDDGLRAEASAQNERDLGEGNHGKPEWDDAIQTAIQNGDQKFMWKLIAQRMKSGQDNEDTEERNKRWIESRVNTEGALHRGDNQLWIVGASHLPGLVLRLSQAGWTVTTEGLITDPQDGRGSGHVDRVVAGGVEATRTRR